MTDIPLGRRAFLGAAAASTALLSNTNSARALDRDDTYQYPVSYSEADWRERLSGIEHYVMREGGTEVPHSSPLSKNTDAGIYCCKGCDLTVYRSLQKIQLDRGWVFFRHSLKDTVMTDLDLGQGTMGDLFAEMRAMIEVHCRRCGSHLGHMVAMPQVKGRPIHCINGAALRFEPADV